MPFTAPACGDAGRVFFTVPAILELSANASQNNDLYATDVPLSKDRIFRFCAHRC